MGESEPLVAAQLINRLDEINMFTYFMSICIDNALEVPVWTGHMLFWRLAYQVMRTISAM